MTKEQEIEQARRQYDALGQSCDRLLQAQIKAQSTGNWPLFKKIRDAHSRVVQRRRYLKVLIEVLPGIQGQEPNPRSKSFWR